MNEEKFLQQELFEQEQYISDLIEKKSYISKCFNVFARPSAIKNC